MKIKFPDTLIKVIALKSDRYPILKPIEYKRVNIGDIFLAESDDFLRSYFNLYTLDKEYVCRASNDGYNFNTLAEWREKQIKKVIE